MKYRLLLTAFFISFVPQFLYGTDYIKVFYVLWGNGARGDCMFIELPGGKNVLIDGGGHSGAESGLHKFLRDDRGISKINFMVLTHADWDHHAGLRMVMDNFEVENFYCTGQDEVDIMNEDKPNRMSSEGCDVWRISTFTAITSKQPYECYFSGSQCNYGSNWDAAVDVRVLCADDNAPEPNSRSLVIKLSMGESSFYFGGDARGTEEDYIRSNVPEERNIDVFKVEHHASNTHDSNNQNFIDWMNPKFAIIPSGGRSAPPPAIETVERLINSKIIIYTNYLDGTVVVKADEYGNYDIIRLKAVTNISVDGDGYYVPFPEPLAYPSQTPSGDFKISSEMPYILSPPAIPAGLTVAARSRHEITLDWTYDPSPSIEGYYVFYSTRQGGDPGANNGWKNAGMGEEAGIYQRYNSTPITHHPYNLTGLVADTSYYFRLSALTTYYYERRYSNEASTTTLPPFLPVTITALSGMVLNGDGDINLSWIAPSVSTETPTVACHRYRVIYASYSFSAFSSPFTYEIDYGAPEEFGIDFSTVPPKDPGQSEKFYIKNVPHGIKYFAVFGENGYGDKGYISNISTLTVVDSSFPTFISNTSVSRSGSDGLYLTWTMPGDNGDAGQIDSADIIYAQDSSFSSVSTTTISESSFPQGSKSQTLTLSEYTRYWIKIEARDEAGNTSSSTIVSCYTGANLITTPSFSDSISASTSAALNVTFKIEIDTVSAGAPGDSVEIWDMRDNLGAIISTKLATDQYQLTAAADARSFTVSPNSPEFDFNHKYALVVSSSLKDIDKEIMMVNATYYYFVTVCSPSEDNIFIASDGSSVTVRSGSFSQPASLTFDLSPLSDLAVQSAYNVLMGTYVLSGAVRGFSVSPGTVTALIPVSGGIPYVYNKETKVFEQETSYISNGEVVFGAESPAVWLFVTRDSFMAYRAAFPLLNTPSFSDSVSVSTSPTLDVTFKIEIDTVTAGSPSNCVELWDTRDNLGVAALTKLTTNQYQVTASTDSRGFSVLPGFDFNHKYKIVISSSLKDIHREMLMNAATFFYFVTVCSPSEDNFFLDEVSGSSVTVAAGQFSSPASVSLTSTLPADLAGALLTAYNLLPSTYTATVSAIKGFTVLPGTVTAVIPVSGGIPYVYNSDTLSFEKALSYITNGEVVFDAESPAVWLFVTQDSFTANKDPGIYAYPVPCTGNSITFTNLGASAEVGVFTISGKCVMREKVVPDPVNGEWVWNFSRVSPGLYFWAVDGTSKGMLMIKR